MRVYGVSESDMQIALQETNSEFDGNVMFNRFDVTKDNTGKVRFITFTLKVRDSSKKGARRGIGTNRKMVSACWHVHGTFFEKLLIVKPTARILSTMAGKVLEITKDSGNWQDLNIGSDRNPVYASEACEC